MFFNALLRHVLDAVIVAFALALFLAAAFGRGDVGGYPAPAVPGSPPPLTDLRTMSAVDADTRYSIDSVSQDGKNVLSADRPAEITIERDVPATITGWAVDAPGQRSADAVFVLLSGRPVASCRTGIMRTDVAAAYNIFAYGTSGFSCILAPSSEKTGRFAVQLDIALPGSRAFYPVKVPTQLVIR